MTYFVLFSSHSGTVSRGSSLSPVPIPFFGPHEPFGQTLLGGFVCRAYLASSFLPMSSAVKIYIYIYIVVIFYVQWGNGVYVYFIIISTYGFN